VLIVRIFRNR